MPFTILVGILIKRLYKMAVQKRNDHRRRCFPSLTVAAYGHVLSIFMTNAWIEEKGVQNAAAYSCFPKFLPWSREGGGLFR